MKSLVIVSHGSRRSEANEEMILLAKQIKRQTAGIFKEVLPAFLECTEPTLEGQVDKLVSQGQQKIVIFPLFLAAGTHVTKDIPQILKVCSESHPEVSFELKTHLGALEQLQRIIIDDVQ